MAAICNYGDGFKWALWDNLAQFTYIKMFGFFYWLYVSELQCDVICLSPIQAYGQFAGLWISL